MLAVRSGVAGAAAIGNRPASVLAAATQLAPPPPRRPRCDGGASCARAAASGAALVGAWLSRRVRGPLHGGARRLSTWRHGVDAEALTLSPQPHPNNLEVLRHAQVPSEDLPTFRAHKARILERTLLHDRSPKGSVDSRCVSILNEINRHAEFVTTTSCSGRALFMSYAASGSAVEEEVKLPGAETKSGRWLVTHDEIEDPEAFFALDQAPLSENLDNLWFMVQAFELHVACASTADAFRLVNVAQRVFHRASVISPSREWRTVVAVAGNQRIEMPFALGGRGVYSGSAEALAAIANGKLRKNWAAMERLREVVKEEL